MKVKTSITISSDLLVELNRFTSIGSRSDFIEKAIWRYLELQDRDLRNKRDLELLNSESINLNTEALDVLAYQVQI
jgi:metal-responsive CopG/Arc/MetJ family transcriptional regulator